MTIFMVTALPLILGLFTYAFYPDELGRTSFWLSFLKGIVVWITAFLVYIVAKNLLNDAFTFGKLFGIHLMHDFAYFFFAALVGFTLFFGLNARSSSFDAFPQILAFVAGTQILIPVSDLILKSGWFDVYSLFLSPLIRTCLCIGVALIVTWAFTSYGPIKYASLAVALLPPVAMTVVPALFGVSQGVAGSAVAAFAVALTAIAVLLTRRARV